MRNSKKRLVLNKETVIQLGIYQLERVKGGLIPTAAGGCTYGGGGICPGVTELSDCPSTSFTVYQLPL